MKGYQLGALAAAIAITTGCDYTGDWLFGLSWSLFAGFGSVLPYFYPIYFGVLLVHRAWRDDHMCQEKYGEDWARFKKLVPYVFVPYLF